MNKGDMIETVQAVFLSHTSKTFFIRITECFQVGTPVALSNSYINQQLNVVTIGSQSN